MLVLREQLVLGKLLGQGAATLGQRVGAQVGQQGAGNGPGSMPLWVIKSSSSVQITALK